MVYDNLMRKMNFIIWRIKRSQ